MKKFLLIFILAALVVTGTAFADHPDGKWGIGVIGSWHGNWTGGGYGGASFALKLPSTPVFWAINLGFNSDYFGLGVSGDIYFVENTLVPEIRLHWFIGLGGWANLRLGSYSNFAFGARLPIGIHWHLIDAVELFLDIAPSLGVNVSPFEFPAGGFPIELGVRFWF